MEGYKTIAVISTKRGLSNRSLGRKIRRSILFAASLAWLGLVVLSCGLSCAAQAQQSPPAQQSPSGIINGTVVDATGAAVSGAHIRLTRADQSSSEEKVADSDGQFFFANVTPGPFQLTVTAQGFSTQTTSGVLNGGGVLNLPPITMSLATVMTEVHVTPHTEAQAELKAEEKQRVLGVIPNFYVSYVPEAAPLAPEQKFQLALKATIDPVTYVVVAATAGIEQATNYYSGYGQGAAAYGERFGATYANYVTATFIGSAILPSLFKQDPRYFYKGTGSTRSRFLYAFGNTFFCKGDNGRWQPNYSNLGGNLISSAIGNAYDPPSNRGVGPTFEGALIGIGATGAANVIEEFVMSKLTSNIPRRNPSTP
ncbi:MAG: carboxypeptidase-like regulatory domain-containing protein [Candidatus Acidiferrales bacterium]